MEIHKLNHHTDIKYTFLWAYMEDICVILFCWKWMICKLHSFYSTKKIQFPKICLETLNKLVRLDSLPRINRDSPTKAKDMNSFVRHFFSRPSKTFFVLASRRLPKFRWDLMCILLLWDTDLPPPFCWCKSQAQSQ